MLARSTRQSTSDAPSSNNDSYNNNTNINNHNEMRTSKGEPSPKYLAPPSPPQHDHLPDRWPAVKTSVRLEMLTNSQGNNGPNARNMPHFLCTELRPALTSAIASRKLLAPPSPFHCSQATLDKIQKVSAAKILWSWLWLHFLFLPLPPFLENHLLASLAECATQVTAN